jgi:hypothetical protein
MLRAMAMGLVVLYWLAPRYTPLAIEPVLVIFVFGRAHGSSTGWCLAPSGAGNAPTMPQGRKTMKHLYRPKRVGLIAHSNRLPATKE